MTDFRQQPPQLVEQEPFGGTEPGRELILVIDSQQETRDFIIRGLLIPSGYRVLLAQDIREGIQKAIDAEPDLILLNLERLGLRALQELEKQRASTPFVLYGSPGAQDPALQTWLSAVRETIVEPFAPNAVLAAVERVLREHRLRQERDSLREQLQFQLREQKTLHAIGHAMTRLNSQSQVFNRLVEAAVYLSAADAGFLFLREPDSDQICLRAYLEAGRPRARLEHRPTQDQRVAQVVESGEAQIRLEPGTALATSPADGKPAPSAADTPEWGHSASALMDVPIQLHGSSIGMIRVIQTAQSEKRHSPVLPASRGNTFTADDLFKLSVLASYGAVAIENASLRQQIEDSVEHMAICEIGASLSSTLRLDSILDMLMQAAIRLLNAECGYIVLLDKETGTYVPRITYGLGANGLSGQELVHRTLAIGEPILTVIRQAKVPDEPTRAFYAAICVPIPSASGMMGAIYVQHSDYRHYFQEYHRDILSALVENAAAAVENARLFNQVEAERRKLEAVIRGTDEPVIVTDMDGTVLLMNTAAHRAFDTRKSRATGMLLPQVSDHPALAHLFNQARISGQVQHGELALEHERTLSATVTPILGVGFVTVMQDVTELKQLSEMKSEFVATVSHDLRSPLSTVLGLLNVLRQAGPLSGEQQEFATSAEQEVKRLISLTSDLLDLGRLEADLDLEMQACDLSALVAAALENWQNKASQRGHTLRADLPAERVFVYGNAMRLRQVVDNLISNAVKYTLDGGYIVVRLARDGSEAVLQVEDSGIGIPAQDQPYVFDRFYRVHNRETRDIEGTGLGLAIVKSAVQRHKGRVWVRSSPGKGSTFGIVLPAIEAPPGQPG